MDETLGRMLVTAADRYGDRHLLVAVDRTLSFNELNTLSSQFARQLQAMGITAGDRVTLWMENGWRWMVAYYGILKIGAVVNPCNILLTPEEVLFIASDCQSRGVIAAQDKIASLRGRTSALLIADRSGIDGAISTLEAMIDRPGAANDLLVWGDGHSVATICYTSGTTGHPKGAVLSHRSIIINTAMTVLMHGCASQDTVVSALPCSHVYGNIVMNSAVLAGMLLILLPRFEEAEVLKAIAVHRATLFEGVPTMFMKLLNFSSFDQYDLSSLRLCTAGGQTMPVAKMEETERRFGCALIELWGMTEIGGLGITHPYNGPRRLGSIGVPMPLCEAKIVAVDDASQELQRGEIGELMFRGPLLMDGYYGNESATRSTIEPDGWLRTGDLARQDVDGYFYVVDRTKEVIITGGYNVYPAEIERVIAEHPAVAMVAVAAARHELKGEVPKAFVVRRAGTVCTSQDLTEYCRSRLASYKIPTDVTFVDDLPKTSTGKVLRRLLATSRD